MNAIIDQPVTATPVPPISEPLRQLFFNELATMHSAETQLTHALPLVAKMAKSDELQAVLKIHLEETVGHVKCIEQVAESLQEDLPRKTCQAMKGLIREVVGLMIKKRNSPLLDIALIAAAQKVEHYEIASYGTMCAWAKKMGYEHELTLLTSILQQEKNADKLLTAIARGRPTSKLADLLLKS